MVAMFVSVIAALYVYNRYIAKEVDDRNKRDEDNSKKETK